jgi:hypothetical protein
MIFVCQVRPTDLFDSDLVKLSQTTSLGSFVSEHWPPVPELLLLLLQLGLNIVILEHIAKHVGRSFRSQDLL